MQESSGIFYVKFMPHKLDSGLKGAQKWQDIAIYEILGKVIDFLNFIGSKCSTNNNIFEELLKS